MYPPGEINVCGCLDIVHLRWLMCSGSEAGSYPRLMHCVYDSTLALRVLKKEPGGGTRGGKEGGTPPRTTIGAWAQAYCRVLGWGGFV